MARSSSSPFTPPDRRGEVLRLQRLHHLRHADARRLQRRGLELDRQLALDPADHLHLGHARDRRAARA